jgi:peptidase M28-like protein
LRRWAAAALALAALAPALATAARPRSEDPYAAARHVVAFGSRPAAGRAEGRAHAYVKRAFLKAGLKVSVQRFHVPGKGQSRNVIGVYPTPHRCLRIVMAHTDSMPRAPGANDNASGVGVVASMAPRLRRVRPTCDVWLVATGSEERLYTGKPDHLGALALARRVRARKLRGRLRWALSLDEVGRGSGFWLRSPVGRARRGVEGALLRAARRSHVSVRWVRDSGTGNSDHREFQLLGMRAAKLGVAVDDPCRHQPCDSPRRLQRGPLLRARSVVERALHAP